MFLQCPYATVNEASFFHAPGPGPSGLGPGSATAPDHCRRRFHQTRLRLQLIRTPPVSIVTRRQRFRPTRLRSQLIRTPSSPPRPRHPSPGTSDVCRRSRRCTNLDPLSRRLSADSTVGWRTGVRDNSRSSWPSSGVELLAAGATMSRCTTAATEPSGVCFGQRRRCRVAEIMGSPQPARVKKARIGLSVRRGYHLRSDKRPPIHHPRAQGVRQKLQKVKNIANLFYITYWSTSALFHTMCWCWRFLVM